MTPAETARQIASGDAWLSTAYDGHEHPFADIDKAALAQEIEQAILAERERCARLCDAEWDAWGQKGDMAQVAADLAKAIREGR